MKHGKAIVTGTSSASAGRALVTGASSASADRALVTGASRGIGKAIAEALVREGWSVTGTCRNPRRLAPKERVAGVRYVALDLGNEKSIAALVRAAGEVDLLVNNAVKAPSARPKKSPSAPCAGILTSTFSALPWSCKASCQPCAGNKAG